MESMESDSAGMDDVPTSSPTGGETKRIYPGDLICYRANKPYEWLPWYGVVLSPTNEFVKYIKTKNQKNGNDCSRPTSADNLNFSTNSNSSTNINLKSATLPPLAKEYDSSLTDFAEDGLSTPIYVNWTHSNRIGCIYNKDEFRLVDRNVPRGCRVKNEDGVLGTVVDTCAKVTLQIINTNHVIENVPIQDLKPVSGFVRGREIQYEGWVGIITAVRREVTCRLDNGGAIFRLKTKEMDGFVQDDPYWGIGRACPGIRNNFPPEIMRRAIFNSSMMQFLHRWVPPVSQMYTRAPSTTLRVQTTSVDVMWLERCPSMNDDSSSDKPPGTIPKDKLPQIKLLGLPNYETLKLNSIRMYQIKPEDTIRSYTNWFSGFQYEFFGALPVANSAPARFSNSRNSLLSQSAPGREVPVKLIFRQAEVEVDWDNGTKEHLPAANIPILLHPGKSGKNSEFERGSVVTLAKEGSEDEGKKCGIVVETKDDDSNVVHVRWTSPKSEGKEEEPTQPEVKKESVSDIQLHESLYLPDRGTTVFIKDHPLGYECGTVVNIDISCGKLFLAVPDSKELVPVDFHKVTPLSHRCYWNFHTKEWVREATRSSPE